MHPRKQQSFASLVYTPGYVLETISDVYLIMIHYWRVCSTEVVKNSLGCRIQWNQFHFVLSWGINMYEQNMSMSTWRCLINFSTKKNNNKNLIYYLCSFVIAYTAKRDRQSKMRYPPSRKRQSNPVNSHLYCFRTAQALEHMDVTLIKRKQLSNQDADNLVLQYFAFQKISEIIK